MATPQLKQSIITFILILYDTKKFVKNIGNSIFYRRILDN